MALQWIFLLSAIILYVSYGFFKRRNFPPGPIGFPILGCLPFLDATVPYRSLTDLSRKYGPIYGMYLGSIYTVVLSDAGMIREAFRREEFTGRAPLYVTHGIMGGYGIICAEGPLWKDQRRQSIEWLKKLGMTKFGPLRRSLERRIKAGIAEFLEMVQPGDEGESLDLMHALHHSMGNVVNGMVFGVTYDRDDATWKYLQKLQEEGVKHIGVSGVVNFLPLLRFWPSNRKTIAFLLNGKRETHALYDRIIDRARQVELRESESPGDSILKYFLREKETRSRAHDDSSVEMYSDVQLRHLLADLFGAGVDTTLTTLRWFLLYMAKDLGLQAHLRSLIVNVVMSGGAEGGDGGDDGDGPSLGDLEKLDFLKACMSETQRIRSVAPLGIPHGTTQKTELCGYEIPKNAMVIPLQWAVHMDPKNWTDPEIFDPYRFLDKNGKYFLPPNLIPFQTGKRMCLGEELARMMLYIFCGSIVYHYEFTTDPTSDINMEGHCGITLTPPKYNLILKKLKHF